MQFVSCQNERFHTTMLAYLINHIREYQLLTALRSNEWNRYKYYRFIMSIINVLATETVSQYMMT